MTAINYWQFIFYLFVLLILIKPLGTYIAIIYEKKSYGFIEQYIYKFCGVKPNDEMDWKQYLTAMLVFNGLGLLCIYLIQRLQFYLPLNPEALPAVSTHLAFNTAASFISNTDWQAYSGEFTMSYFTAMLALTVQNFLSTATGISLLIAFIRGLQRQESHSLGNFWVDITRGTLYILLPLATIFAIFLTSQGVIQNFKPYQTATSYQTPTQITKIPMGPVASQVAIKQLGTNGGGYFNVNSAHPFENPNSLTNFLEMLAIILIPAALCYTFGVMINDTKQGIAILIAMFIIFIPCTLITNYAEQKSNPALTQMGVDARPQRNLYPAGNMEGKETRFGIINSAIWATSTTATANGSVNAMHDSFMPLSGFILLWLMHLGEVVFGGAGSGLYGMLMLIMLTVFIGGLMVGRTPEYLGKKIEPYEIKMVSLVVLIIPLLVLISTAISVVTSTATQSLNNPGAHGFSEILYAFTSMGNNNGSAFAGLNANTVFYNTLGGIIMLISRYWLAIPILAIAGSLAQKKRIPLSLGTLSTHTPLFIILLVSITLIVGALAFLPALALGPITEHFMLWEAYGS